MTRGYLVKANSQIFSASSDPMLYLNVALSQAQSDYQRSLIAARSIVERAFGILKMRFQILGREYRGKLEHFPSVCLSAGVLHNMATLFKQPIEEHVPPDAGANVDLPFVQNGAIANQVRNAYCDRHFG
ncbi:hypothetical protein FOZ62_020060 [Perkinsus olseni]|uniref:DDE Tnp4 domain-containing protein n=2 Tax=Perkinsus olseni TaxID=32597 RepID=A0A7J6S781_PEROL|nr:hypothetical protein FOZ62_020060 [Perkinsus olseni]